ncbi:hypothetical protein QQZ08_007941 [Neonectria magnoliae]|uniref:non-specific serine/threonine protein kinase n=1 Tax=Neonectria magnoliae TaxID=2732573 RepID=A0ABR1HWG9_9HYPO
MSYVDKFSSTSMATPVGAKPAGADNTAADWGDFVDSDGECDVEDASEPPERYQEGLYYPVCIGEVLANRYCIQHKLGHGGFSTVWMAHDLLSKQDIALKIMKPGGSGEHEYWAHNRIIAAARDTSHLLTYRDTFFLDGSHGRHRVLVLPLQSPNLRDYTWRTSVAERISAAKQLLEDLKSLHDLGIVHRGASRRASRLYTWG